MISTREENEHAIIEQRDPRLLEVRLKTGTLLNEDAISHIIGSCRAMMGCGPCAVLVLVPRPVDFDPHTMTIDLARMNGPAEDPLALAVVCEDHTIECMVDLYFAYFPQPFAVRVFNAVNSAYEWLSGRPLACSIS